MVEGLITPRPFFLPSKESIEGGLYGLRTSTTTCVSFRTYAQLSVAKGFTPLAPL